jgi:predicted nucleotidyltransferase component of viral defense system
MITYNAITQWSVDHKWPTRRQVEQDLRLSQALCEIYSDKFLAKELLFRGGTAFHKLFMDTPRRYSEDLDFVRTATGPIGDIMKKLTQLGIQLGYNVSSKMTTYPKIYWKTTSEDGLPIRIKIELDTYDNSPYFPVISKELHISNAWYSNSAEIQTFTAEELISTKIRALYQRSKGRDLFDFWLALNELNLKTDEILEAFSIYRPDGLTAKLAIANLNQKLLDSTFCSDINALTISSLEEYSPNNAAELIIEKILSRI